MKQSEVTFDVLSNTEFEEFTYDLLSAIGFYELNWRKGTGLPSSPSDQGRDIECKYRTKAPDGNDQEERWFVECKHYKRGVPPEELQSALSWAQAERPDKMLFVVSNFLSNPAKECLKHYQESNRPSFKIIYWELPKLQELSRVQTRILRKYGLLGEFPLLGLLHPFHIRYLKLTLPNSLDYFFGLLDDLDPSERKEILEATEHEIINPRFREPPQDYKGTIGELMIDKVDYPTFKEKCYELAKSIDQSLVVTLVVNVTFQWLLNLGDSSNLGRIIENHRALISHLRASIDRGEPDAQTMASVIHKSEQMIKELPKQTQASYQRYVKFCERVVGPLFDEQIKLQLP